MRLRLPILAFGLIFFACTQEKEPTQKAPDTSAEAAPSSNQNPSATINQPASLARKDSAQKASPGPDEMAKNTSLPLNPVQALLRSLDTGRKVEFAPLDLQVLREDTLIKARAGLFEISFATDCLNDSLIAQEMFDYGGTNTKSYLISHNYKTNIAIKKMAAPWASNSSKKKFLKDN
ncbi:MAG: hypothetical protein HC913_00450 [Microscillaceae bacterium]|nr:hypothetical protein [Microscillaceae bacterium]